MGAGTGAADRPWLVLGATLVAVSIMLAVACCVNAVRARARARARALDRPGASGSGSASGSCGAGSCKALDPVMDPAYNMQNACKQSILLEEHLNNENKRCEDCCKKHMLHIVGLAEEAISLAGPGADPEILATPGHYNALLEKMLAGGDPLEIAAGCRAQRKVLMAKYVV